MKTTVLFNGLPTHPQSNPSVASLLQSALATRLKRTKPDEHLSLRLRSVSNT
jgi:hypothetical protein